jgi:hypothetical protein
MVVLSLGGTEVPIYLLDGTRFMLRVMPTTLAGACMVAVREKIGLVHDTHYGLFEAGEDGEFRALDDRVQLSKVLARWPSLTSASRVPLGLALRRPAQPAPPPP